MQGQAETRLVELQREFEAGQARLRDAELEVTRLRETLLRISGAIQVLQELLTPAETGADAVAEAPAPAEQATSRGQR